MFCIDGTRDQTRFGIFLWIPKQSYQQCAQYSTSTYTISRLIKPERGCVSRSTSVTNSGLKHCTLVLYASNSANLEYQRKRCLLGRYYRQGLNMADYQGRWHPPNFKSEYFTQSVLRNSTICIKHVIFPSLWLFKRQEIPSGIGFVRLGPTTESEWVILKKVHLLHAFLQLLMLLRIIQMELQSRN